MLWVAGTAQVVGILAAWNGSIATAIQDVTFMILALFQVVSLLSLVFRHLRSTGTVRQQIKCFTFAVVAGVALPNVLSELVGDLVPIPQIIWDLALATALLAVPMSIGVAILRYHLYEIDRLVSRTVTYLIVIGLLGLLFIAMTWLPWILVIGVGADGPTPPWLIAAATLIAAALFNPLRKRVQRGSTAGSTGHTTTQPVSRSHSEKAFVTLTTSRRSSAG